MPADSTNRVCLLKTVMLVVMSGFGLNQAFFVRSQGEHGAHRVSFEAHAIMLRFATAALRRTAVSKH